MLQKNIYNLADVYIQQADISYYKTILNIINVK